MKEQFHDLSFAVLEDGTIRMEQHDYCGESVIVDVHPQQIIYIARTVTAACRTQSNSTAERITTLERRLRWMRDRFLECHAALPSDMYDRCPEASEFYAWLQASIDVANEYCADLDRVSDSGIEILTELQLVFPLDDLETTEPVHVADGDQMGLDGME